MEVYPMSDTKTAARQKYEEYKAATKKSTNKLYQDLKKVYYQIYKGKKVIDIHKVISKGGVHDNYHPKLATAKATSKQVYCRYHDNGKVSFLNQESTWKAFAGDVSIDLCLPEIPRDVFKDRWTSSLNLKAPVPMIPANLMPDKLTDDYYILWEVDTWTQVPPVDPYLLRRITPNCFVIVAAWDLTELERAVMKGRMS